MNDGHFWLTVEQFGRLVPHLPGDTQGKPRVDDRRVISGIVHAPKSGGRWADAPPVYVPRKTLYNRFVRRAAKGVGSNILHALATAGGPPTQVVIYLTAVHAYRSARGRKGGGSVPKRSDDPVGDEPPKSRPEQSAQSSVRLPADQRSACAPSIATASR